MDSYEFDDMLEMAKGINISEDIKHFDVIGSCLQKLRKRTGRTRLVKVKATVVS